MKFKNAGLKAGRALLMALFLGTTGLMIGCSAPPAEVFVYNIGALRVDCVGHFPQSCYVVNGEFFYDSIEGFDEQYRAGCEYRIRVERRPSEFYGDENALGGDAPLYRYRLLEVVSDSCNS